MNKNYTKTFVISIILLIASCIFSICAGSVKISFADIVSDVSVYNIVLYSRIPRTLAAIFCGAALSVAGGILQSVLNNKLASPSIIGVNAGAGLGVTLCCAFGLLSGIYISVFAFLGSLISVILISVFAVKTQASKTSVILGGVALNSILNAISESVLALSPETSVLTTDFKVGGFSAVSYKRLIPSICMIVFALAVISLLFNELDALVLGDETAKSIGVNTKKYRIIFLVLCALLSGAAVSFAGLIGFIGLIVPHFVKKLSFLQSKRFLPLCAVVGGAFVCLCDTLARIIFKPFELPVGIIMAIVGGPLFVIILINSKGGHAND